ncbi:MAG: ankyrin repeat domain-containing protein [Faunusvirus sp.]|jgi:ankyrin repeat protein|uniref:Ankyrin repeat domain-containing protein n=1 Tax=Faunusvirus sp. TaxID=2487766 RepID=A0A3G4ZXB8_9VIRU|nr:MAG: ankyrin repeat domain-containing protein [Faunusvirus sp.]
MGINCSSPHVGADPAAQTKSTIPTKTAEPYDLVNACKNSHQEIVIDLIDREGLNIDIQDDAGNTALIHAVCNRLVDVVDELLKKRVDVNTINKVGLSAIDYACGREISAMMAIDMVIATKLINSGIDLSRKYIDLQPPIIYLANKHQWNVVRLLLEKNVDLSYKNSDASNILMLLLTCTDLPNDILLTLLLKFDLNTTAYGDLTCVQIAHFTSLKLFMQLIDYITEYKLQFNFDKVITANSENRINGEIGIMQYTLLGYACTIPDSVAAVKLIEAGADPTIGLKCADKTVDKLSIVEIAQRNGLNDVIEALAKRGYPLTELY